MKQDSIHSVDRASGDQPLDEVPPPYSATIDPDAIDQALGLGGLHAALNSQENFVELTVLRRWTR